MPGLEQGFKLGLQLQIEPGLEPELKPGFEPGLKPGCEPGLFNYYYFYFFPTFENKVPVLGLQGPEPDYTLAYFYIKIIPHFVFYISNKEKEFFFCGHWKSNLGNLTQDTFTYHHTIRALAAKEPEFFNYIYCKSNYI